MKPRAWIWSFAMILLAAHGALGQEAAASGLREYGSFPWIGSRTAVWIAAEVHLMFAAFVLGVPMFAVVAEGIGIFGGDERYDRLSKEFTRLLLIAYSATAMGRRPRFLPDHALSALLGPYDRDIRSLDVDLRGAVLRRIVHALPLLLRLGSLKKGRGKIGHWTLGILLNVWGRPSVHRGQLADLHDEPAGGRGARHLTRHGPVLERVRERDLDAHQHPPSDRQRGVRRVGGRRLRADTASSLRRPTKSAPTTTGWATWGT